MWRPQFKSKQKHKLPSHASNIRASKLYASNARHTHTNILWDICGFYAHITQRHNGQTLPSSHALLSLSLTHSPSAPFLHHECICVSTWWWECQTPVGIGIETHKRTFCSEHSLLGRTQLLIFARMFCLFIFILFFSSSSFLRHFAWHSSSERPSWVSKWVYAIQCFHICCLRFSHKRIYHIYSISVKKQQITEYAFFTWLKVVVWISVILRFRFLFLSLHVCDRAYEYMWWYKRAYWSLETKIWTCIRFDFLYWFYLIHSRSECECLVCCLCPAMHGKEPNHSIGQLVAFLSVQTTFLFCHFCSCS